MTLVILIDQLCSPRLSIQRRLSALIAFVYLHFRFSLAWIPVIQVHVQQWSSYSLRANAEALIRLTDPE